MIKNNLRENGFHVDYKEPRESSVSTVWTILTLAIIAVSFFGVLVLTKDMAEMDAFDPLAVIVRFIFGTFGLPLGIVVFLFLFLTIYFGLKVVMTMFVCKNKRNNICLKVLKGRGIPVCNCKEALKVWQIVLIYIVPVAVIYFSLFVLSVVSRGAITYFPMLVLLSVLMAFDLTLVIHVLFYKIKDGIDYVSVENHVYQMTMFKKPVEENKKVSRRLNRI